MALFDDIGKKLTDGQVNVVYIVVNAVYTIKENMLRGFHTMKKIMILTVLAALSFVSGCGRLTVSEPVNSTISKTDEVSVSGNNNENEPEVAEADEKIERDSISIKFEYSFKPDKNDMGHSSVTGVRVMLHNGMDIFSKSGRLTSEISNSDNIPYVFFDKSEIILTEDCINRIREQDIGMYNDNMRDIIDVVKQAYLFASEIFDSTEKTSDGFPVDYTEHMPSELRVNVDGNIIRMDVKGCELDEWGFITEHDDEEGLISTLTDISLDFSCEADDLSALKEFYSEIKKDCSGMTEELDPKTITVKDVLIIESSGDNSESELEPNNGNNSTDAGILGRWYPEYSDFSEYYIQFNEDGDGFIFRDGEEMAIKYTYSNGIVKVNVLSTGGTNEFYYEYGNLRSDFDGSVYSRKTTSEQEAEKNEAEPAALADLTGTWYDPTGLSPGGFVFNGDGTGTWIWDFGGKSAAPDPITYEVKGNVITIHLSNVDAKLTIRGSKLSDGDSMYVKR